MWRWAADLCPIETQARSKLALWIDWIHLLAHMLVLGVPMNTLVSELSSTVSAFAWFSYSFHLGFRFLAMTLVSFSTPTLVQHSQRIHGQRIEKQNAKCIR